MAVHREGLGEEISEVKEGRDIREEELVLAHSVAEPIEAQVHGLALLWADGSMCQTYGTFVVAEYGCGGLRIAKVAESSTEEAAALGISESRGEFRLGRGGT